MKYPFTIKRERGFTLLELLVALIIFSILSAMAYSGLNQIVIAKERTEKNAKRLSNLQRAFTMLGRDIEQTVNRQIRGPYGDPQPALVGNYGGYGDYMLELSRTGWRNPANNPRSNLQRVAYGVRDDKLYRYMWYMLDRAQDSEPFEVEVLDNIKEVTITYIDKQQEPHQGWPDTLGSEPDKSPPRAVVVEIEMEGFGKVKRMFRVPG